jgi:hypothetical protein
VDGGEIEPMAMVVGSLRSIRSEGAISDLHTRQPQLLIIIHPIGVLAVSSPVLQASSQKEARMRLSTPTTTTFVFCSFFLSTARAGTSLMDSKGSLQLQSIPTISSNLVAVISSPGTPSFVSTPPVNDDVLTLTDANLLVCQGATLGETTVACIHALAACARVASCLVVDGLTVGDVQAGLFNSRHARTLTALFRGKQKSTAPQTIVLVVQGDVEEIETEQVKAQVRSLYEAVAVESATKVPSFEDAYKLEVLSANSKADAVKVK